jgi:solute carrier family 30 (zinc transporter), member 2
MSDAAHMLSDVSSFLVALFAAWAATQPSTEHYSFGYHRAEIMGALVSVLIIWLVTGALVFEAVQRVINPVAVNGKCKVPLLSSQRSHHSQYRAHTMPTWNV